ncbi:MAG: winged helix DNA-binding domain-containing protein [Chloroflexota bacterium]|nr:MAG: winged helix DNA-binding domain-containing protein [Chloroflexota bacterium]
MHKSSLVLQRLAQQGLTQRPFHSPQEVVAWLGAVQAQEYEDAKWALGIRMRHATDDQIERALADGTILRTHVMRPTWHYVTPADIRWLLELTAPRVNAANASMYRQLELDEALFERSNAVIAEALRGGRTCTRAELGAALERAGIVARGVRLAHIVQRAELDAVVCSGPRRGKQITYALLEERAPHARRLPREEALAELTRRYYTGHGPATVHDFAWWSGLTMADARAGLALVASELDHTTIDGQTYYFPASMPPAPETESAFLLPPYDELVIAFSPHGGSRAAGQVIPQNVIFDSLVIVGDRFVGSWRRTFARGTTVITVAPFAPLTPAQEAAIAAAVEQYGEFIGTPVQYTVVS